MTLQPVNIQYSQAVDIEFNEKKLMKMFDYFRLVKQAHQRLVHQSRSIDMYERLQHFPHMVAKYQHRYEITLMAYNRCMHLYKKKMFELVTEKVPNN